jgi:catechol 2,3-dioxygenase-like lactoylglutathione lyase family enzyme
MGEWGIAGIQQVGAGVSDLDAAFRWFRRHLGTDVPVFTDEGTAALMLPYTGGVPRARKAVLAENLQGGGALEIWQYRERTPLPPAFPVRLGDLGIFCAAFKARDPAAAYAALSAMGAESYAPPAADPAGGLHFFLKGPESLPCNVVAGEEWFSRGRGPTGGVCGCMIGVSDVGRSLPFYAGLLGYDQVLYDRTGCFPDIAPLPGGCGEFHRVLLSHSAPRHGAFSRLTGPSRIELIQALDRPPRKIFEGRLWGDPGFIHLCFDIWGMDGLKTHCDAAGFPFTVDSAESFGMGEAAGRFAYVEDPDGTLIEFVETRRVVIVAALGLSLDMRKRDPRRPLPDWMIKTLALRRVRD